MMKRPGVFTSNDVTSERHTTRAMSGPLPWLCRASICILILVMLLDGATKLISWSMVMQTMDRMGYGSSEYLARVMGLVSMCVPIYAFPPTSFVGAIVAAGYLGGAVLPHLVMDGLLVTAGLSALGLVTILSVDSLMRDKGARLPALFAR